MGGFRNSPTEINCR